MGLLKTLFAKNCWILLCSCSLFLAVDMVLLPALQPRTDSSYVVIVMFCIPYLSENISLHFKIMSYQLLTPLQLG